MPLGTRSAVSTEPCRHPAHIAPEAISMPVAVSVSISVDVHTFRWYNIGRTVAIAASIIIAATASERTPSACLSLLLSPPIIKLL